MHPDTAFAFGCFGFLTVCVICLTIAYVLKG